MIPSPDAAAPRILISASDPETSERLQRLLGEAGCRVEIATDAQDAFAAALREPPDLCLVDAELPEGGGFALLRRLRAADATQHVPVVLLLQVPDEGARRDGLAAGADDCMPKPVRPRELLSRVGLQLAMARVGREASAAVRASERRLAEVLEAIGDSVYAMDRDERILFANQKALQFWGKTSDEVIGRRLLEVFPGIEHGEPYLAYRRVRESGEPAHLETRAPALGDRWIGLDVHPAPNDGVVVAFRDIDAGKRAAAQLRESEERFRMMLEALPDKAFVIRPNGMADYYNQQMRDYAGPIGPAPSDRSALHPPEDRERVDRMRARAFAVGEPFTVEARLRRDDGALRWHRIRNRPVRVNGEILFWLGTAVDIDDMRETNTLLEQRVAERTAELEAANRRLAAQIDEREKTEAQLRQAQRIEAVGQLTSGVAHDFNNLLTAVMGNLELLETQIPDNERARRLVTAAMTAAERGARLTTQLLAFSRQQQLRPERVDLNRIVGDLGALMHSTLGARIRIDTVLSQELWLAMADASQIELVLLNLAINARDAMPEGGAITITTANIVRDAPRRPEEPPPGHYAMVAVADTGSGIAPEIRDKVFDPFFTTKDIGKGSGLGLSQVLGVAQELGGGVQIDTTPGKGTTVSLFLPRVRSRGAGRDEGAVPNRMAALGGAESRRSRLILLVDDDSDVRAVTAAMLGAAGYQVIETGSAGAALECLERQGGDVALMIADIAMPGMSGIALAHAARRDRPGLPIVFVTGFATAAMPLAAGNPDSGRNHLLRKPFRASQLVQAVADALEDENSGSSIAPPPRPTG